MLLTRLSHQKKETKVLLNSGQNVVLEEEAPGDVPASTGTDAPEVPEGPSTELDLNEIVNDDLSDEDVAKPAAAPAVKPSVQPPATPAPVAQVVTTPVVPVLATPAAQPQQTPTPAPVAVQPPAPSAPAAPASTETPVDFATLRSQQVDRLAQAYALSPEDARLMAIEPEKVMPKMAARLHVDVFEATFNALVAALPRLMESHSQARTAREEAKNEFFTEFPALKDPQYQTAVETAVSMFRQMNPSATRAQAIAAAGVQVSLAHQIPLPAKFMQGYTAMQAVPPVPAAPFAPVGPGASGVPPAGGVPNYFAKIAEEDVEDRG